MNTVHALCSFALEQGGAGALPQVLSVLGDHLSDSSKRLVRALQRANDRAWRSLEIAVAGERLWNKLDRAEDRAFRQQVATFLRTMPMEDLRGNDSFRRQCLADLREARRKGLTSGQPQAAVLAERTGAFARHTDPQALVARQKQAIEEMAEILSLAGLQSLALLLRQQPHPGQSVLVVAVRYFFRREVEQDAELARGLQFTALEGLSEAQQQGFAHLEETLTIHGSRVEEALGDVHAVVTETRDAVLDLHAELQRMQGEQRQFCAQVLQMLERQQLHNRPVHAGDSLSMRTDHERQMVKSLLARYRSVPEEKQRPTPALLNGLGKLQLAVGDYAEAQEAFSRAGTLAPDQRSRGEAHHNAYRAALERATLGEGDYEAALAELNEAVGCDPARFAPFPPDDYEALRILGAGGFGVTFLCRLKLSGAMVAVKALATEELERDVGAVLQEASALDQLQHPAIIRLRHCGYADPARTRPYLVMEYFEGATLEEYIRKHGPLSVSQFVPLARLIAGALYAAHGKGILHRDVKPANLLVRRSGNRWEVRLIDFGLALKQELLESGASTRRGRTISGAAIAGTLDYAAPEQMGKLRGVAIGPPADVYGFAKTCCYALFHNTEPTFQDYEKLPRGLAALLGQCLARTPQERPGSFAAVLKLLDSLATEQTASPRKPAGTASAPVVLEEVDPEPSPRVPPPLPESRRGVPVAVAAARFVPEPPVVAVQPFDDRRDEQLRRARSSVRVPACFLILVNVLAMTFHSLLLLGGFVSIKKTVGDSPTLTYVVAALALEAFTVLAGLRMVRLRNYYLALTGCFAGFVSTGVCCLFGAPCAFWGLVALNRDEVSSAFR
jgi:serine/threonine protein kinase